MSSVLKNMLFRRQLWRSLLKLLGQLFIFLLLLTVASFYCFSNILFVQIFHRMCYFNIIKVQLTLFNMTSIAWSYTPWFKVILSDKNIEVLYERSCSTKAAAQPHSFKNRVSGVYGDNLVFNAQLILSHQYTFKNNLIRLSLHQTLY